MSTAKNVGSGATFVQTRYVFPPGGGEPSNAVDLSDGGGHDVGTFQLTLQNGEQVTFDLQAYVALSGVAATGLVSVSLLVETAPDQWANILQLQADVVGNPNSEVLLNGAKTYACINGAFQINLNPPPSVPATLDFKVQATATAALVGLVDEETVYVVINRIQ